MKKSQMAKMREERHEEVKRADRIRKKSKGKNIKFRCKQ